MKQLLNISLDSKRGNYGVSCYLNFRSSRHHKKYFLVQITKLNNLITEILNKKITENEFNRLLNNEKIENILKIINYKEIKVKVECAVCGSDAMCNLKGGIPICDECLKNGQNQDEDDELIVSDEE